MLVKRNAPLINEFFVSSLEEVDQLDSFGNRTKIDWRGAHVLAVSSLTVMNLVIHGHS